MNQARYEIVKGQPVWWWLDLFKCHYELHSDGFKLISFPKTGNALDQYSHIMSIFIIIKNEMHLIMSKEK